MPAVFLGERSATNLRIIERLRQECDLRIELIADAPAELRRQNGSLVIAVPESLGALGGPQPMSVLRWRLLVLLLSRSDLLDGVPYAGWSDGYLFLDGGGSLRTRFELVSAGLTVLPDYVPSPFALDTVRRDRLAELRADALWVLRLLGEGLSNAEIARHIEASPSTVKTIVRNLMTLLRFSSRTQAGVFAWFARAELARMLGIDPDARPVATAGEEEDGADD